MSANHNNSSATLPIMGVVLLWIIWIYLVCLCVEADLIGLALVMLCGPPLILLYWPIKSVIAYWQRTAPERERKRAIARQQSSERAAVAQQQRLDQQRDQEEKAKQAHADRDVKEAQAKVKEFYGEHANMLKEIFPPHLFLASLKSEIPDSSTPEVAWTAARTLIAQLVKLVAERRQELIQKEEEDKRRSKVLTRHPINPEDV